MCTSPSLVFIRLTTLVTTVLFVSTSFIPCTVGASDEPPLIERSYEGGVMGTDLKIRVYGADASTLDAAIKAASREIARVEDVMTDWRPSPLVKLNASAGMGPHAVPKELFDLVKRSLDISDATGGAFDVTYAGVGRLWNFKSSPAVIPPDETIQAALKNVGFKKIGLDEHANTVSLPAGFSIGLGGIAKGYGVDRAMAVLLKHKVQHGIVNAGGDMKVLGLKNGKPWEIAIKHPRDRERVLALLKVSNTCVVTSGDYERYFEIDGKRYHHIIDPRTGYPGVGSLSTTVVAQSAELADALATGLSIMGPEKGIALVEKLDRVEAIMVGGDGVVHVSTGLTGSVL